MVGGVRHEMVESYLEKLFLPIASTHTILVSYQYNTHRKWSCFQLRTLSIKLC